MKTSAADFLLDVKNELLAEKKALEYQIRELKSQDPFSDQDRLIDNAASDQEANEESGHDRVAALISASELRLKDIVAAFTRIESGKYGLCSNCGQPIEHKRLEALPTATLCINCEAAKAT